MARKTPDEYLATKPDRHSVFVVRYRRIVIKSGERMIEVHVPEGTAAPTIFAWRTCEDEDYSRQCIDARKK